MVPNFAFFFFLNRWFSVRHQLNSTTSPTTLYEPKYKTVLHCMSPSTQKPSVLLNLLNPILGRYVGFWRAIGYLQKWHAHIRARNRKPQKLTITKQPCTRAITQMGGETSAHVVPHPFVRRIQSPVWRPGDEYIYVEAVQPTGVELL